MTLHAARARLRVHARNALALLLHFAQAMPVRFRQPCDEVRPYTKLLYLLRASIADRFVMLVDGQVAMSGGQTELRRPDLLFSRFLG
jgi:hypothetical protein